MLTTSAADRNGHVASVRLRKIRQCPHHKLIEAPEEAHRSRIVVQKPDHRGVETGHVAQLGLPVGIRQRASVKDKV